MTYHALHAILPVQKDSYNRKRAPEPRKAAPTLHQAASCAVAQDNPTPPADPGDAKDRRLPQHAAASEEGPISRPPPIQTRLDRATETAEISYDIAPFLQHESQTPEELEASRPATPTSRQEVDITQSWRNPSINKWRFISACLVAIGNGMNDSGKSSKATQDSH